MANVNRTRIALPVLVIVPLVWLMVGCVYIPWFEQVHLAPGRPDFRNRDGGSALGSLTDGLTTRAQILRLLGEPLARSGNRRVIVYTLHTQHGIWIEPLCFHVTPGGQYLYALGLRFDERGILEAHHLVVTDIAPDVGLYLGPDPVTHATDEALVKIDQSNGVDTDRLSYRGQDPSRYDPRDEFSVSHPVR